MLWVIELEGNWYMTGDRQVKEYLTIKDECTGLFFFLIRAFSAYIMSVAKYRTVEPVR